MGVVLSIAAGMIIWVVTWALGWRNMDGGLVLLLAALFGATGRMILNQLPGNQDQSQANPDAAPFN